jgi:hypothetical protein
MFFLLALALLVVVIKAFNRDACERFQSGLVKCTVINSEKVSSDSKW